MALSGLFERARRTSAIGGKADIPGHDSIIGALTEPMTLTALALSVTLSGHSIPLERGENGGHREAILKSVAAESGASGVR
jgi:hypothetical protein